MPPRKADSATPQVDASPVSKSTEKKDKEAVPIEDLSLPRSIITRLAKGVLPPNTQIQGNAILALSKSATVFISYLAAHANENTTAAGKKTVLPADVFKALDDTEFGFLRERLEAEFKKFNALQAEKRSTYRQKVKAAKSAPDDTEMADVTDDPTEPRAAKKQRVDTDPDDDDDHEDDDDEGEEEEEEDEDEEEVEEEDDDEEDDDEDTGGGEELDELEERRNGEEHDEALDGDESD